jgi:hypothetical protein
LWEESVQTIEEQSMAFCMFLLQNVVGMICLNATAHIKTLREGLRGSQKKEQGTGLLKSMLTRIC